MGRVKFKSKATKEIVEAEFPLAEMPDLVAFTGKTENGHMAKADFLTVYVQEVPELPAPETTNIPELEVEHVEGSHVALPKTEHGHATSHHLSKHR
jgi:hypothetical protein